MVDEDAAEEQTEGRQRRRPGQSVECGWCGRPVKVPARGRVPSWCSSACRHRAWEARRAAREQALEVKVVTRTIEVDNPVVRMVEVPVPVEPRSAEDWATTLEMLATQLAHGRVYRRDMPILEPAIQHLFDVWIRTANQHR